MESERPKFWYEMLAVAFGSYGSLNFSSAEKSGPWKAEIWLQIGRIFFEASAVA